MKPNTGTIGRNSRKTKETHPDSSGSINAVCQNCGHSNDYWLSGWTKEGERGKFSHLALKDKQPIVQSTPVNNDVDFDDALGF